MHMSFGDWVFVDVAMMDPGRTQPVLHPLILGIQVACRVVDHEDVGIDELSVGELIFAFQPPLWIVIGSVTSAAAATFTFKFPDPRADLGLGLELPPPR